MYGEIFLVLKRHIRKLPEATEQDIFFFYNHIMALTLVPGKLF